MIKEILVIDDNPDIRFLICNILEEQNFKVRSAANFDQAVLEINSRLPDLAIIDIRDAPNPRATKAFIISLLSTSRLIRII